MNKTNVKSKDETKPASVIFADFFMCEICVKATKV